MTTMRHNILIGLTVLSLGTASFAVQAADTAPVGQPAHGPKFADQMAKRQAMLHDKLKLSAAQEPAWNTFIAAALPHAPGLRPDHAAMAKMSAPERLEQWITMSQQRLAMMQTRLSALKTFYATLTPEQQKVLNDNVPGGAHGARQHGKHGAQHE